MKRLFLLLLFATLAHAQSPQLAITFDDLPVHGALPPGVTRLDVANQILAVVKQQHLPTVYGMVNATHVDKDASTLAILKAWRAAGQPLASHTYSHMNPSEHSVADFEKDILADEPLLESLTKDQKEDWRYLRYPYLNEGDRDQPKRLAIRQWLAAHNYKVAEVTLEFNDYNFNPPYARCMVKHDAASVARLHDLYLATAHQHFAAYREAAKTLWGHDIPYVLLLHIGAFDAHMFPELIAQIKAEGFAFTTLAEAERDPAYNADPATAASTMLGGGPLQDQLLHARNLPVPHRDDPTKELESLCR